MGKKYYGKETEKAIQNFPFRGNNQFRVYKFHKEFLRALITVKRSSGRANAKAGNFSKDIGDAIVEACDRLLKEDRRYLREQFPLPALMGGAGTSIHMNANEVIANMATEILKKKGKKIVVNPNDHVNRGQSTNDVNPSALKVASIPLLKELEGTLDHVASTMEKKAKEFKNITKLARTHLQDAVPITLGEEFAAWADIVRDHEHGIARLIDLASILNLGGTAVGNTLNATPKYRKFVYEELKKNTCHKFVPARNLMAHTGSASDLLMISQAITVMCMDFSKIATDLRFLSSGPRGGLGEITLLELQKGSSIMPGKVNPIMPETVNQLFYLVSGNNLTIEHATHGANLELAVMIPSIIDRLLQTLKITNDVLMVFADRCIVHIVANKERCKELLERSTAYATALTPVLGYETMAEIVKESVRTGKMIHEIVIDERKLLTKSEFDRIVNSFKP